MPPRFAIRMNVGISVTWNGTMTIARNDQNMTSLPRKRFLAKAYPASAERNSTATTDTSE